MSRAVPVSERLRTAGVTMIALCWVDNAGITRVKANPYLVTGSLIAAGLAGLDSAPAADSRRSATLIGGRFSSMLAGYLAEHLRIAVHRGMVDGTSGAPADEPEGP